MSWEQIKKGASSVKESANKASEKGRGITEKGRGYIDKDRDTGYARNPDEPRPVFAHLKKQDVNSFAPPPKRSVSESIGSSQVSHSSNYVLQKTISQTPAQPSPESQRQRPDAQSSIRRPSAASSISSQGVRTEQYSFFHPNFY